jgi:hypothetical protein
MTLMVVKMNGMSPTMEMKVRMSCLLKRLPTADFARRFPLRVVECVLNAQDDFSYSANQPNDSLYSIGNDGEFSVCIECDETRVATAFHSPPFSRRFPCRVVECILNVQGDYFC